MNDFIASLPKKIDKFIEILIDYNGYVKVLQGLQNTLKIAVLGLIIGIVIGTLIATVRVIPKYKVLPRILNAICAFYVALFRGTPMVVQLLIFYYVVLPIMGVNLPSVSVAIAVFGLNSGAYISEIMRSGQDTPHARIYDRLLEMCAPVCFSGENFRRESAQNKLNRLKQLMND